MTSLTEAARQSIPTNIEIVYEKLSSRVVVRGEVRHTKKNLLTITLRDLQDAKGYLEKMRTVVTSPWYGDDIDRAWSSGAIAGHKCYGERIAQAVARLMADNKFEPSPLDWIEPSGDLVVIGGNGRTVMVCVDVKDQNIVITRNQYVGRTTERLFVAHWTLFGTREGRLEAFNALTGQEWFTTPIETALSTALNYLRRRFDPAEVAACA